MMTEEEAREKWCPFGANVAQKMVKWDDEKMNIYPVPPDKREARCIGSRCMAWQWISPPRDDPPRTGYCGAFKQ